MTSPAASQQAEPTPVSLVDSQSQVAALKEEPVKAATPQGDLVAVDEPMMAKVDPPATMHDHLPKTASELPLLLALGFASLLGILPIRFAIYSRRGR